MGHPGQLPDVYSELKIEFHMLRRLLGVKSDDQNTNKVKKIRENETLMLNVGSTQTGGRVEKLDDVKSVFKDPNEVEFGHTCVYQCR